MPTWRIRLGSIIGLAAYSVFVAFVAFWPTPVDRPFDGTLFGMLGALRGAGISPDDAYAVLEFTANIAFFIVPGLLLVLIVGRRWWWLSPVVGLLCSIAIELAQHFLLPSRYGTVQDVIANTLGALIGAAVGALVLRRRRASAGKRKVTSSSRD